MSACAHVSVPSVFPPTHKLTCPCTHGGFDADMGLHMGMHLHIDMRVGLRTDMCIGMCVLGLCIDISVDMCSGLCKDPYNDRKSNVGSCKDMQAYVYTSV